jgi:hypothetical protein
MGIVRWQWGSLKRGDEIVARKALKKVFNGHYQYTIDGSVYEFDRMLRSETGERTHWNIKIKGGQYFDGAQTLEECIQLARNTSIGMSILADEKV